jgi:hypothetical protein
MGKRKDWEVHREEIERLFLQEKWILDDVIEHLRSKRGFHASWVKTSTTNNSAACPGLLIPVQKTLIPTTAESVESSEVL